MLGSGHAYRHLTEQKVTGDFQIERIMKKLLEHFTENPKKLLLIDSVGALMSAFSLFVIVRQFNEYFGMPQHILTYLSVIAVSFSIYSAACYFLLKERLKPYIRIIGIANIVYCASTLALLITFHSLLTVLGIAYFSIEILIICGLSYVELNVAAKI